MKRFGLPFAMIIMLALLALAHSVRFHPQERQWRQRAPYRQISWRCARLVLPRDVRRDSDVAVLGARGPRPTCANMQVVATKYRG